MSACGESPTAQGLQNERSERDGLVHSGGSLIVRQQDDVRWWTWAGFRANATLAATLSEVVDPMHRFDDRQIRLREDVTPATWREATGDATTRLCLPNVSEKHWSVSSSAQRCPSG
jgi:ATP-dependent Lhr-like helicase